LHKETFKQHLREQLDKVFDNKRIWKGPTTMTTQSSPGYAAWLESAVVSTSDPLKQVAMKNFARGSNNEREL
jgi:hypothetical protein